MDVRRELAFLFAGAVLGALVTVIIEEFQAQKPSAIILIASVVVLTWLTLLSIRLIGPLHLVLRRVAANLEQRVVVRRH